MPRSYQMCCEKSGWPMSCATWILLGCVKVFGWFQDQYRFTIRYNLFWNKQQTNSRIESVCFRKAIYCNKSLNKFVLFIVLLISKLFSHSKQLQVIPMHAVQWFKMLTSLAVFWANRLEKKKHRCDAFVFLVTWRCKNRVEIYWLMYYIRFWCILLIGPFYEDSAAVFVLVLLAFGYIFVDWTYWSTRHIFEILESGFFILFCCLGQMISNYYTLPKTNSLPLKHGGWFRWLSSWDCLVSGFTLVSRSNRGFGVCFGC